MMMTSSVLGGDFSSFRFTDLPVRQHAESSDEFDVT